MTPSWLERSEFRRRTQEPPEGVLEFHQALRLLGRRAYPTMKAADMEQMLLDQFVHGVSDPEVRKALLRAQPSTLAAALQLAQQEEALQAACSVRPMDLFRVTSVRPSPTVDAGTQTPWRPCSCGSFSPRQGNWRRQPPRRPNGPQNRRPVQSIDVGPQDNGGLSFTHQFVVSPDITWDCIIGVDFLNKFNCSLDFGKRSLRAATVSVPFLSNTPKPRRLPTCAVSVDVKDLVPAHLDEGSARKLSQLVSEFKDIFDWDGKSTGRTGVTEHCIDTGDARPIRVPPRRLPIFYQKELDALINDMLSRKIIRPSQSPWSSPIVLVKKKDGSMRLCIDYRKLNAVTKKDSFPLPRIDTTLDALAGNSMFSTLDLASGYWQVEVRPSGLYEFETMPFGLANAPSTFQRLMNQVLAQLIPTSCLVYMDDIIVLGKDFDSHLNNIRAVFSSLRQAGLTLKPSKCVFLKPRVKFLGHVVSAAGIETDDEKVTQIREWPTPADVTEVRSFLGLASYYRRFIKDYAQIAGPLHKLTQKDVKFKWTADCTNSFQTLKDKLCSTPILVFPDVSNDAGKFILDTDASDTAIGAVLSQQQSDGTERVIQYLSRSLTKAERRYCVTRKEMLALTHFVEECRPYLQYRPFVVRTDQSALTWLRNFKNPEGQVARWQEKLAEYDFECVFRPGRQHGNADALSRKPHRPHGECPSCTDIAISAIALQSDQCLLWAAAQRDDPHICPIYDRKVSNARPLSKAELAGHSYETRCLHSLWDKLFIENGVLFYRDNEQYPKRVVLPLSMVDDVVERMHAELGHSGTHKTEWALRRRYYWPNQKTDIQNILRSCGHCLGFKSPGHSYRAPLQPIKTGYPNERVAVDLVGPIAPSARGDRFILVMVDCFTKMAEAVPLPDASAPTVARAIFNGWICRWGAPDQLHSDRGSSFESCVVHELCKVLKIKKTRTTAYHPQGNGQVERTNRTLINLLRAFVDRNSASTWDEALPACMLAYRSTENATTQHTPFFLTCGREMQLPEDLHLPPIHPVENVDTYASRMKKALRIASEEARLHLQEGQRRQKAFYDRLAPGTPYQEGDIVWMRNFAPSPGVPQKFNPAWIGPYVVRRVLSDTTCVVRSQDRPYSEEFTVHFNRLKPGPSTEEDTDLTDSGASSSHAYHDQPVERYLEVPLEGGYASAEVLRDGHPVGETVEVPPDGGPAIALDDSAEDSRPFSQGGAMRVPNVHWIIIEDSENLTRAVTEFRYKCPVPSTQLCSKSPQTRRIKGSNQRNEGLKWIRSHTSWPEQNGVVYFADDDNTYDPRIFEEMRTTIRGSTWPVGLVGGRVREGCLTDAKDPTRITGFDATFRPRRKFPIDMAAFAVNLELIHRYPNAAFDYVHANEQEGWILSQLGFKNAYELEPKASGCTEILVWHTKTRPPRVDPIALNPPPVKY
ncbi:hypothetical protein SprV_0401608100 [Sparganum proliferum]